mgnify:FL=1
MNNPFGISDDLMTAAIVAAMKERSAQQQKNSKLENPFNVDTVAMAKKSAKTTKQLYDAYVEVGFTQEQAFELVKGILTAKKN